MALEYIEDINDESHGHFYLRWSFYSIGGIT
jgi:hypothetical protein